VRHLQRLVDAADVAALLLAVDGLCASREWDQLADLARRCREAVELGKQLWSVATHIDYRLALEGPPEHAAAVLAPGAGRFALGPLTEVAAATHAWDDLAPHLRDPASTVAVAQERVLRGEDLRGREGAAGVDAWQQLADGPPLWLAEWEPAYALPRYRDRSATFPQHEVMVRGLPPPSPCRPAIELAADEAVRALRALVTAWVDESAGTVAAVAVEGDAAGAVGRLLAGPHGRGADDGPGASLLAVTPAEGMAILQWTGANGGAYGRRPGGAAGRFAAWWTAAMLTGLDWPVPPSELGDAVAQLRWYRWRAAAGDRDAEGDGRSAGSAPSRTDTGWVLRLAVADPVDGLAWAVAAADRLADDPLA
jgi:hypothetical protein